jgi:hypothetical protein
VTGVQTCALPIFKLADADRNVSSTTLSVVAMLFATLVYLGLTLAAAPILAWLGPKILQG